MGKLAFLDTYPNLVKRLKGEKDYDSAMQQAIGGQFEATGIMERELLFQQGLPKDGYLIDIGCCSGRLAIPLEESFEGKYLGTDVVEELLDYARDKVTRKDWKFKAVTDIAIPEEDNKADMVCFFSVITHLKHEESYVYLQEAKRVLKPGGKIVFSFLEFGIPCHWNVFDGNINDLLNGGNHPLNQFISRDGIEAWAEHLDLKIEAIFDGDKPHIPLPHKLTLEDGTEVENEWSLGQSVCVMTLA